ncbi:MAG: 3-phosphoshikimate 1-carboxyvinyltransferase [Hadesarchaea archaeon]|nr:3-phosphoshikimate 1-carboxyvinyltransferase [Hadesarchaea archaeon]
MSWLKVESSKLEGEIKAQPSKSYTHRAISVGLLANGESKIKQPLESLDTRASLEASKILGAKISENKDTWKITGTNGEITPRKDFIDVKNSGTTLRFMSAIAALSPNPIQLSGDASIQERPMKPLIKALKKLGASAECKGENFRPPVIVGGGIEGGKVSITGEISSQFISGLLLACPFAENAVDLVIKEKLKSKPYVKMSLEVIKSAKGEIKNNSNLTEFHIPNNQEFKPIDYVVPGDFSSAAFILGAGALTGSNVTVSNLNPNDVQGDKRIIDLIKEFGIEVLTHDKSVEVTGKGKLEGIKADCSDTPDLVPVLAILGAASEGTTRLLNIQHLRYKEVDRLKALASEIKKLGAKVNEKRDELQITGVNQLKGGKFDSYGDHRIAMALAIAGLDSQDPVFIENAECIDVSYPDFVNDMKSLGAQLEIQKEKTSRK